MLPNIFWSRTDYISGAYATKMVAISSPGTSTCCPRITGRKNWQAWHTASISKQLMCRFDSSSDHRPKVGLPSHSAPQPLLEASVVTTFLLCAVSRVTPRFSQRGFLQWVRADTQARVTVMRWRRANGHHANEFVIRFQSGAAWSRWWQEGGGQPRSPITLPHLKPPRERLSSSSLSLTPNEITSLAAAEGHWSSWVKRTGECSLCGQQGWWALSRRELASHRLLKYSDPANFFITGPWEAENWRARGAESLSEKKAILERREARLKHSQWEQSAPLSAASPLDFPKHDTHSAWVSCACKADYIARRPSHFGGLWRAE